MMMQIGPCEGIEMGDDLWMARYLLHRVAEVPLALNIKVLSLIVVDNEREWRQGGKSCHHEICLL